MIIILAGSLLRLIDIGGVPVGLNQDEASTGYEAWALLNYGMDRNGDSLPVLFVSWGSGQNVLYSYLSIPFIAIFGLNTFSVRLLSGLLGSAALSIFYLLAKRIRGTSFGLTALLILALNPWHIMLSRWALESNLLPFFLLLGIYFLVLARERPRFLSLSALAFGLSLYSYGTAFMFLPVFLILSAVYFIRNREFKTGPVLASIAIFVVLALPITLCNILNALGYGEIKLLGLTLPALTQTRQAATTVFGSGGLSGVISNLVDFFKLLWKQSDGLPWNFSGDYGLYYGVPGLLLAVFGLICSIYSIKKQVGQQSECFILFALIASFFAACLMDVNINRINMVFIPIIYLQAVGIYFAIHALGEKSIFAFVSALILLCGLFVYNYFTKHQETLSPYFFEGLGEAIEYAESLDTGTIWITEEINAPYIYVLFYVRIPPEEFTQSVQYSNPNAAFRFVSAFGKYRFGGVKPKRDCVYIMPADDTEGMLILARFGSYAVTALS